MAAQRRFSGLGGSPVLCDNSTSDRSEVVCVRACEWEFVNWVVQDLLGDGSLVRAGPPRIGEGPFLRERQSQLPPRRVRKGLRSWRCRESPSGRARCRSRLQGQLRQASWKDFPYISFRQKSPRTFKPVNRAVPDLIGDLSQSLRCDAIIVGEPLGPATGQRGR
jgi:hypothetical protein